MSEVVSPESAFCDAARAYLLSFSERGVDPQVLARYLEPGDALRARDIHGVYRKLLCSCQNANMKTTVVSGSMTGGLAALSPVLFGFDPRSVVERYGDDSEAVLDDIVAKVKPRGQVRRTRRSIWPQYCRSIVSGAKFLAQFRDAEEFYAWADKFDLDDQTRPELPLTISKDVEGLGFALACDFVKELGYSDFAKPDVHIKKILVGLRLIPESASDYAVFTALTSFARSAGLSPYHVDKLMWLVGSGWFYWHPEIGTVPTRRDEFVASMRSIFDAPA